MKFSFVITYLKEGSPEVLNSIKNMNYFKEEYEILCLPGKGSPSIYRNKGADIGKGEIICFIDDDAIAHKDLLKNAESFFNEHPEIDIVGGPQLTPLDEKGFAKISGYALSSKFGGWNTSNRYSTKTTNLNADDTYLTTAIMFCRKNVFEKVRFDEKLFPGEDSKFVLEAKKQGLKIAYSPDLIVYHKRRPTIKKFITQIFNYGKVTSTRISSRELIKQPFFFIPSIFFFYVLAIIINSSFLFQKNNFSEEINIFALMFLVPLCLYFILNLFFSISASIKNKDFLGMCLPFIFPILHLSYGAGMIYGYLKK